MTMEYEWHITTEDGGDPTEVIKELIENYEGFGPYRIFVDSDVAGYVEFGTLPSTTPPRPKSQQGTPTDVELKFRKWVQTKFPSSDKVTANALAHKIYKKTMQEGMRPSPFMRPAMFTVLDNAEACNLMTPYLDTHTVEDLADEIVELMHRFLETNDTHYTGELEDSIRGPEKVELDSDTDEATVDTNPNGDLWNDRTRGVNPNRTPRTGYRSELI